MNYWIFQCNQDAYTINPELLTVWQVKNYRNEILAGDKAIIWITGPQGGVYALANIENNPDPSIPYIDNQQWNLNTALGAGHAQTYPTVPKVKVSILAKPDQLIGRGTIIGQLGFESFTAGKPGSFGTNLRSTQQEYERIQELINLRLTNG